MILSTKAKEAIKTGLAFAIVYGIALRSGWMNPYWAGLAVAMISLQTAGQSLHKGMNRMAGTIPGCVAAIFILSLTSQNRWGFLLLTCAWIFFTSYMLLRSKNNSYFWTVAGFVCLIIISKGGSSSESIFQDAAFRMTETLMGIAVYTLIAVFLWPRSNAGMIRKVSTALMATQAGLIQAGRSAMTGEVTASATVRNPAELQQREVAQLSQLGQVLVAEGSESYEVHELRHLWDRFHILSTEVMVSLDRWHTSMTELVRIDVGAVLTDIPDFFDELGFRFDQIKQLLEGSPANHEPHSVSLHLNHTALDGLPHFERAALTVARIELENLETQTASLLECARNLAGQAASGSTLNPSPRPAARSPGIQSFVFDLDHLQAAAYAATTVCVSYLIWIFVNPPGHIGWIVLMGVLALVTVSTLQAVLAMFVKPLALAIVLSLSVYVFIMPQLTTYYELGLLLFLCMFINRYYFSGVAQAMGNIGIIVMIPIQNQQTYDFAMQANSALYLVLVFISMFALSYLVSSPRQEKRVLAQIRRFFRSTEFLMSSTACEPGNKPTLMNQWKTAFYEHEMKSLPGKIATWGKAINQSKFSSNTPEQVQNLVTTLQGLVYRMEQLLAVSKVRQADFLKHEMKRDIRNWRANIESTFLKWSESAGAGPAAAIEQRLASGLGSLEQRIDGIIEQTDTDMLSEEDSENFYRLLGAYRGVSEASVAYAGTADVIDWADWHEERF
jgi:uncharacterized membrane protein YccC